MLINSAANLQNLDSNDAGIYALGQNLTASPSTPLAIANPFTGTLDGMNHSITGLTITNPGNEPTGFFSVIGTNGRVRNLNLLNASATGNTLSNYAGVVAGINQGGIISNVNVAGSLSATDTEYVGGLTGSNEGIIQGSSAAITFNFAGATYIGLAGGLSGFNSGPIKNSFATGSISYLGSGSYPGGLVGYGSSGSITGSHAAGTVTGGNSSLVGGLAGESEDPITNSYATGAVSSSGNYTGGLVGYLESPVISSDATGNVSVSGTSNYAGGLIGYTDAAVTSSNASGIVTGGQYAGGSATFSQANAGTGLGVILSGLTISASDGSIPVFGYQLASPAFSANIGEIRPATLTYSADPAARLSGVANPLFTGTVSGFVNGETLADVTTGNLVFTSPATIASAPGSYAINGSGLSANHGNYVFIESPASVTALTISAANSGSGSGSCSSGSGSGSGSSGSGSSGSGSGMGHCF